MALKPPGAAQTPKIEKPPIPNNSTLCTDDPRKWAQRFHKQCLAHATLSPRTEQLKKPRKRQVQPGTLPPAKQKAIWAMNHIWAKNRIMAMSHIMASWAHCTNRHNGKTKAAISAIIPQNVRRGNRANNNSHQYHLVANSAHLPF